MRLLPLLTLHGLTATLALMGFAACKSEGTPSEGAEEPFPDTVTWHEHIRPLVVGKCVGCHQEGSIAPMALDTYELASMWSRQMAAATEAGTMPPWGAHDTDECTHPGEFKDDLRLSDREKELLAVWARTGTEEGSPEDAAELPEPIETKLASPDSSLRMPASVTVDGDKDSFVCFRLDPELVEDTWVTGAQVTPGNEKIVHHALVFLDADDESAALVDDEGKYDCFGGPGLGATTLLQAWAPGVTPLRPPDGTAMKIPAGAKLVVQAHYHPTGSGPEVDADTTVEMTFTDATPTHTAELYLIGNFGEENDPVAGGEGYGLTTGPDFVIPAGAKNHVEINRFKIPESDLSVPLKLWVVGTHMHYVGRDMLVTVESDGDSSCLVHTPNWDFNWQRGYFFDGPIGSLPTVYTGDDLVMRCTYDNSMDNAFVREALEDQGLDAPIDVSLGEETLDEMCLGVFGILVPNL